VAISAKLSSCVQNIQTLLSTDLYNMSMLLRKTQVRLTPSS